MKDQLTQTVIGCAMKVHCQLGYGFLEHLYANALAIELKKLGIKHQREAPIKVRYDEFIIGEYRADILIENSLILELKAVGDLSVAHEVQLVNYLTATKIDIGLLINFGTSSLQYKRKHRLKKKPDNSSSDIRLKQQ